jgi:carbon-monoxide dehydrogenase medium subunit
VKPGPFNYHAPTTLPEAIELLATKENAKILAGGQSLLPMMNFRLAMPDHLIDINQLTSLSGIEIADDVVNIGAMTRHRELEFSTALRGVCPLISEAMPHVGHRQTRNRGTIGGSLAHADPAAELPTIVLALGGSIRVEGPGRIREIPMVDFATGFMSTVLEPDEVLTGVAFPRWSPGHGYAFVEFARRLGDFSLAAVAALIELDDQATITRIAVSLAGVGTVQARLSKVEQTLHGQKIDSALLAKAATHAREIDATDDIHASGDYRRHLAEVLVTRALVLASNRARGGARPNR